MPAPVRLPSDRHALQLAWLFSQAEKRLTAALDPILAGRRPGTAARQRIALGQVQAVLTALSRNMHPVAARAALSAWATGVDMAGGPVHGSLAPAPNLPAVEAVARALQDPLDKAIRTVGRSADDALRRAGLEHSGVALITGEARRDTKQAILADLRHQGLTCFVDRAGRRWRLEVYAAMVARTTTREAVTAGFVSSYMARGGDLIEFSDHDADVDICTPYEGKTFSLTGRTPGYPVVDRLAPLHANCKHVVFPARVPLEDTIRQIEDAGSLEELERLLGIPA